MIELANKAAALARSSNACLLYLSSSEVYGRDGQHKESIELIVPAKRGARMEHSPGKLTAEHILLNLSADDQFDLRIVRQFNAAGEWQSSHLGFVIPKLFEAALTGNALQVYGDSTQKRSFCHASDLAEGIFAVQNDTPPDTIYNVGSPNSITTIESLAHAIRNVCNSQSAIDYVHPHKIHGKHFMEAFDKIPDVSRLENYSDWRPLVELSETLQRIHQFYLNSEKYTSNISSPALV
ncbi:MAG: nucleoside-diphosphate-sugar epimerase [Granulosicoccus sp.]